MSIQTSPATESVRRFEFEVSDEELDDLRRRVSATKWPDRETDASQGVQLETIQSLADYWATDYDWRRFEQRFAALPHFVTEIDGVDIHFIHARSRARGRVADDRHPRLAGIDHRAAQAPCATHRSHSTAGAPPTRLIS